MERDQDLALAASRHRHRHPARVLDRPEQCVDPRVTGHVDPLLWNTLRTQVLGVARRGAEVERRQRTGEPPVGLLGKRRA
jgi:hypothetical protein